MQCELVISGSIPVLILLSLGHYFWGRHQAKKRDKKINSAINSVWSSQGGGVQTTEIASLANQLVEKLNNNPSVSTSFGIAAMILTALTTTIYTLSQINEKFCSDTLGGGTEISHVIEPYTLV